MNKGEICINDSLLIRVLQLLRHKKSSFATTSKQKVEEYRPFGTPY